MPALFFTHAAVEDGPVRVDLGAHQREPFLVGVAVAVDKARLLAVFEHGNEAFVLVVAVRTRSLFAVHGLVQHAQIGHQPGDFGALFGRGRFIVFVGHQIPVVGAQRAALHVDGERLVVFIRTFGPVARHRLADSFGPAVVLHDDRFGRLGAARIEPLTIVFRALAVVGILLVPQRRFEHLAALLVGSGNGRPGGIGGSAAGAGVENHRTQSVEPPAQVGGHPVDIAERVPEGVAEDRRHGIVAGHDDESRRIRPVEDIQRRFGVRTRRGALTVPDQPQGGGRTRRRGLYEEGDRLGLRFLGRYRRRRQIERQQSGQQQRQKGE